MNTQSGTPGSDVVLGDDWVRPQSAVDTEVRNHRARRSLFSIFQSPLARKIILFNMLALVLLVAGVLFTNPFRDSLTRQHEVALTAQAEGLADLLGALPALLPGAAPYAGDAARQTRTAALEALSLNDETEVLLLDAAGAVEAARRGTNARAPLTPAAGPQPTLISDVLDAIWSGLSAMVPGNRSPQPEPNALLAELHAEAVQGRSSSRVLRLDDGFRMLAAAPVLVDGAAVGTVVMQQIPAAITSTLRTEREQVLQMFIVALLVSVGLSLVLASTIANPLADLATAAELGRDRNARRMSPGRVRIPDLTGRPDEIGRLSSAMRGMVTALYDRIDANEQFAADVAHEIKNPLASLRSAVGTLRVAKREDQITRLLDVIEHDVRRLDRLISDTSNASRLDS
ncbi:MAG: sensor N-terminal transmembrane domain-containing protein, partial [Pararhodobacter sp.]